MRKKSQALLIGLVAAIALVVAYAAAPAMPGNAPVVRKSAPSAVAPTDEPTDAEPSPVEETPLDSAAAVDEVQMEEVGQSDGDESPDAAEPQASLAEAIDGEVTPEAVDSMEELLEAPHEASVALVCVPQELSATDVQARLNETAGEGAVSVYPVIDGVMEVHFEPEAVPMAEGMAWLETFDFVQDVQPNFVYEDADGDPLEQGADQDAKQQAEDPEDQGDASSGEDESTQDTAQENEPADEPSELDDSRAGDPANATPQQPGEVASTSTAPSASEPTQDPDNADDVASVSSEGAVTVTPLSNDTYSKLQWNLRSINVKSAWDAQVTGAGVSVAVIDAGFDVNHPDMRGVYVGARNVVSGGFNVSGNSHGHEVASVIAANQNTFGTSGVAPGAKVVPVLASKTGYTTANLVKAYEYILSVRSQYNIKVINTSFGFDWSNPNTGDLLVYQKIDEAYAAGIVSVGSAGNNGRVLCHCPCDYGNVVGVMGLEYSGFDTANYTQHDEGRVVRCGSSNYNGSGEICKNISAPGFRVPNLLNGSRSDTYTLSWGTSFAAPHVCATLALMFEANPSLTPAQAISALYSSARDKGSAGWDAYYGYGEINAGAAVEYAQNGRWYSGAAFEVADQGNKAGVYQRSETDANGRVLKAEVNVVGPITGPDTIAVGAASRFTVSQAYPFIYRWSCDNGSSSAASNSFAPVVQRLGTATIRATLVSDPSIVLTKTVNVTQGNVANATVNGIGYQSFTGRAVTPKPVVRMSGLTLVENIDYTLSYANNVNPGTATVVVRGKGNYTGTKNVTFVIVEPPTTVAYQTHVQTYGWQAWRRNGAQAGTTGQAKRLEGINIRLEGARYSGGIQYRTHVQTYGWQGWVADGAVAGTTGQAKRLEAVQIQLTGEMARHYRVWYRVHAQTYGWLGWTSDGGRAGTATLSKRLEAIEVRVLPRTSGAPGPTANPYVTRSVRYRTHVQTYGWQGWAYDGAQAGTTGQAKRLEGINISLPDPLYGGGIRYRTHVQTYGWEAGWRYDGAMSGTSGQAKRLEAIQIQLYGEMASRYDVWYRVHAQTFGWMGWAKNGASAGTAGYAKRLEAIQVVLRPKGSGPPGGTANAFRQR